jgi:carboxyl-terminal processing protease
LWFRPSLGGLQKKWGSKPGDKIIYINKELVAGNGLTNQMVMDRLRGEKGTRVNIGLQRKGEKKLLDFEIIRDKIPYLSASMPHI